MGTPSTSAEQSLPVAVRIIAVRLCMAGIRPAPSSSARTSAPDLLTKLRVTVAQEPGLTQRALNNELVRRFYELPAAERRTVIDAARAWEKEQRP